MFFNLFGGKKEERPKKYFNDLTFLSAAAKQQALVRCLKDNPSVVAVAWFPDTVLQVKGLFVQEGIPESSIVDARNYSALKYPGRKIIFAEHYPVHEKELQLVENAEQESFDVYSSLDEPLFKFFNGERIIDVLKRMGGSETEAFQHSMISKSVESAQKKIAKRITVEQSGTSQAEWFKRNFPKK